MAKKIPNSMRGKISRTVYCGYCLSETGKRVRLVVYSDEYRKHFDTHKVVWVGDLMNMDDYHE